MRTPAKKRFDLNQQGKSYKNAQTLANADFSRADIRGANFSGAILSGADFSRAIAGQQFHWRLVLGAGAFLASLVSGGFLAASATFLAMAFTADFEVRNLVESVQTELGVGADSVFSNVDVTGWAVATFFIALIVFIQQFLRRGIRPTQRYLWYGLGLAFALWILSSVSITLAVTQASNTFGQLALVLSGVAFGGVAALSAGGVLLVATIVLSATLIVADTVCASWITGVFAAWTGGISVVWLLLNLLFAIAEMQESQTDLLWVGLFIPAAMVVSLLVVGSAMWISWQTVAGSAKFTWLRELGLSCATLGGTSFRNATLTNADFSAAALFQCDFRGATLTNVRWRHAEALETARLGETYLSTPAIRQLVVSHQGRGQVFDQMFLEGLNLAEADLADASFVAANCRRTNFEKANMKGAQLVRTQLDEASLNQSMLTGACINNWTVTSSTQLEDIDCRYVFIEMLETQEGTSAERLPKEGAFKPGEFSDYFGAISKSLKITHRLDVKPSAVIASLRRLAVESLSKEGKISQFKILAIEIVEQQLLLTVNFSQNISQEKYYEYYDEQLSVFSTSSSTIDSTAIKRLTDLIEQVKRGDRNMYMYGTEIVIDAKDVTIKTPSGMPPSGSGSNPDEKSTDSKQKGSRSTKVHSTYDPIPNMSDNQTPYSKPNANQPTPLAAVLAERTFIGENFTFGNNSNIIKFSNSIATGNVGNNTFTSSEYDDARADLFHLLQRFDGLVSSADNIHEHDKRDVHESVSMVHKALENPQDEKEQKNADYARSRLSRFMSLVGSKSKETLGISADLATLFPLIVKGITAIFISL